MTQDFHFHYAFPIRDSVASRLCLRWVMAISPVPGGWSRSI